MFKNYFRIGLRNLGKNKGFSLINIFGLSMAMTVALFILLFVQDELTFDRMHGNADRIYRINTNYYRPGTGDEFLSGSSSPAMARGFRDNFPQIESLVRIQERGYLMQHNNEISVQHVFYADSSIFSVFDFPLYSGTAFRGDPNTVVVSREFASVNFANQDPVGKVISLDFGEGFEPLEIVGVAEDAPLNSSIRFDVLLPFAKYARVESTRMDNFLDLMLTSFVMVREDTDIPALKTGLNSFFGENIEEEDRPHFVVELEKLTDLHFSKTDSGNGIAEGRSAQTSVVLSFIGLFILVIAAINYINLSLGMLLPRAGEIGMRKVLGAGKGSIIVQFITETAVITFVAMLLAVLLSDLLQPQFETLMAKQFPLWTAGWPAFLTTALTLFAVITLLAGLYPAIVVARFSSVNALKRTQRLSGHGFFSKFLIVLQFSVSMLFVCGAWVVYQQMSYIQDFDMGYNDERVLYVRFPTTNNEVLRERLTQQAAQSGVISGISGQTGSGWRTTLTVDDKTIEVDHDKIDGRFSEFFDIALVAGRFLDEANPADKNAIVVNESLVNALGLEDPVGQSLPFNYFEDMPEATVVGVIRDYHQASLHEPVRPLVLYTHSDRPLNAVYLRYETGKTRAAVQLLEDFWKTEAIRLPLQYEYLQDLNQTEYAAEMQQQKIISFASMFAVAISCLGLFALSGLYITQQQRTLGIRKVLGASLLSISGTVSRRFSILVLIACLITIPPGWFAAREWLKNFTFRIDLSMWPFVLSTVVLLAVALASILYQAYRAGSVNPVDVLRNE